MMIRQAQLTDIPTLTALLQEILTVHHEVRPDLFKETGQKFSTQELEKLIEDPQQPIFVYEVEGEVVGHLFCKIVSQEHSVLQTVKTLFIDDLCVKQGMRGKRIGQQLYEYALAFAKEQNCYNVTLDVWSDNKEAVAFYQRLGLKQQKVRMESIV
ncbi:GNAT family N-acetyltransferase [Streptococcus marmotae]|uniref:GNAT family N-acetyltransferase n=1 Tax=Streptococcus marmotae TaxID=1825069 RepID=UPI00082BEEFC|nr:GNAT family N-acetyltransferase [Streptococcus marmotae]